MFLQLFSVSIMKHKATPLGGIRIGGHMDWGQLEAVSLRQGRGQVERGQPRSALCASVALVGKL